MSFDWGYSACDGPAVWPSKFPDAAKNKQTPIDIVTGNAQFDQALASNQLNIKYVPAETEKVENTGKSCMASINGDGSTLSGGPLSNRFIAKQFHFHWGSSDKTGSEHTVDGKQFAAELHIVHWNEKMGSFGDAASQTNGLAVLGVLIQSGEESAAAKPLIELLQQITYKGDSRNFNGGFDPASLLPGDRTKYWNYDGSLTTPPCYESVNWILFKDPVSFSPAQLEVFRSLKTTACGCQPKAGDDFGGRMVENYRTICPLNGRIVKSSFK